MNCAPFFFLGFGRSMKIWNIGRGDKPGLVFEDAREDVEEEKSNASVM